MVDEVQTGISRTGDFYCYQGYGVKPDVVTSAKGLGGGLPIGACLCSEKLADVMSAGTHGTTFGGNPIACAGGIAVLERVTSEGFLDEVVKKGEYIGCHPCVNTASLKMRTDDVIKKFLPAVEHEYLTVHLVGE